MTNIEQQHAADVQRVQDQVRSFCAQKKKIKIYHGSTNSTRALRFERDRIIDVSAFDRILAINLDEQYMLVEPNVPMDKLVTASLQFGLVPPVVMEFPGITVGGGIQGGAGESSSFRYGLFHDCCLQYEIVLGNGEVRTVSPEQHADLFYGTACSYGSLGIITLVKLRLVPAKKFIHLTYRTVTSFGEAIQSMQSIIKYTADFVDGIMFSKNLGVVMSGKFSDEQHIPVATFRKPLDEWFFLHANTIAHKHRLYDERIPIADYLFRYDRGGFWVGQYGFRLLRVPFVRLFRVLLNSMFKTRTLFRVLHATNLSQRFLVQDISLPQESVLKFLEFVDRKLHIYPLWLCPLKPGQHDKLSPNFLTTNGVINVGVWGEVSHDYARFVAMNRELETVVMKLHGRKVLYAHQYYPPDEFWKVYDGAWYRALRKKYFADTVFPDVYEKTFVSDKYKPSVLAGVWRLITSPFKLPIS
ncbi:MAG: FAD-binding oxidoreductase [Candidatus Kerfeldbacteria bacterium]|nr:FAD-binding oxidoreductase [Candidatus Kerfeldbacteria bacterium]